MIHRQGLVALFIACFLASPTVRSQNTLPPVKVTAPRIGGGVISCTTTLCANAMDEQQFLERLAFMRMYATYPDQEVLPIDNNKFCASLKKKKPANCNYLLPPVVPLYSSNWAPDGCGSGPIQQLILSGALSRFASGQFSGNLDVPYAGVSFKTACNEHDRCWGVGNTKNVCDNSFSQRMRSACKSVLASGQEDVCNGFAGLYHGAVSVSNSAQETYDKSVMQYSCAGWAYDIKHNKCTP